MADAKVQIVVEALDKASGVLGGIGHALGGVGKLALGLGAGAAVAGISALGVGLGIAVDEALEASEGEAQLNAVLQSTGGIAGVTSDMALTLAGSLQKVTKFTDDQVLEAENLLLTFTGIGKDVFPDATKTLLDMATAMGTDAKSGAIQLGKALNDPAVGMTALTRVGVVFTEEQQNQIKAMTEAGDVAGAQKVILAELQREFGGSAEAAGKTLPGQLAILKNSLYDSLGSAGATLLPIFTQALQGITPVITGLAEQLAAFIQSEGFKKFLTDAGVFITTVLVPAIQDLAAWLGVNLPPIIAFISNLWKTVLQPALQIIWTFIATKVVPILQELGQWLSIKVPAFLAALKLAWDTNFAGIRTIFETTWANLKEGWAAIKALFEGDFTAFGEHLRKIFDNTFKGVKELLTKAMEAVKKIDWGQVGVDIVRGIANGITSAIQWVIRAIMSMASAILNAIKGFLGIKSPSSVMAEQVGKPMAEGVMLGFARNLKPSGFTNSLGMQTLSGGFSRSNGYGGAVPVFVYSPLISSLDATEAETRLTPIIRTILRKL